MTETITSRELSRRLGRTSIERTEEYLRDFEQRGLVEQADGGWRLSERGRAEFGWLATNPLDLDPGESERSRPAREVAKAAELVIGRHGSGGFGRGCACERCVEAHERELERQREREERQRKFQAELAKTRVTWVEPRPRTAREQKPTAPPKQPVRVGAQIRRPTVVPKPTPKPKSRVIDMTDQRYGSLVVIGRDPTRPSGSGRQAYWVARCDDCGGERSVKGSNLRAGTVSRCRGCNAPPRVDREAA